MSNVRHEINQIKTGTCEVPVFILQNRIQFYVWQFCLAVLVTKTKTPVGTGAFQA
jgi:hypothetical protein